MPDQQSETRLLTVPPDLGMFPEIIQRGFPARNMKGCSATTCHNVAIVVYGFVTTQYDSANLTGMLTGKWSRMATLHDHPSTSGWYPKLSRAQSRAPVLTWRLRRPKIPRKAGPLTMVDRTVSHC